MRSQGGAPLGQRELHTASSVPWMTAGEVSAYLAKEPGLDSPVQQQFQDEVDVNVIVRRFGVGQPVALNTMGVYGDFTGVYDYESALERIQGAHDRFMTLPPEVRARFDNDPGKLISAAQSMSEDEFAKVMDPPKAVDTAVMAGEAPAT